MLRFNICRVKLDDVRHFVYAVSCSYHFRALFDALVRLHWTVCFVVLFLLCFVVAIAYGRHITSLLRRPKAQIIIIGHCLPNNCASIDRCPGKTADARYSYGRALSTFNLPLTQRSLSESGCGMAMFSSVNWEAFIFLYLNDDYDSNNFISI